jgi:hypothetical protein
VKYAPATRGAEALDRDESSTAPAGGSMPAVLSHRRVGMTALMPDPVVTKEYREDLGERNAEGSYDYEYRYWIYWFDFDGRRYRARIHTDDPSNASVMEIGSGRTAACGEDLRVIASYLRDDAGIRTVSTLSSTGGFEPVITFDS